MAPGCLVGRPPPQAKQEVRPASGWNVPRAQGWQGVKPSAEYSPGWHRPGGGRTLGEQGPRRAPAPPLCKWDQRDVVRPVRLRWPRLPPQQAEALSCPPADPDEVVCGCLMFSHRAKMETSVDPSEVWRRPAYAASWGLPGPRQPLQCWGPQREGSLPAVPQLLTSWDKKTLGYGRVYRFLPIIFTKLHLLTLRSVLASLI